MIRALGVSVRLWPWFLGTGGDGDIVGAIALGWVSLKAEPDTGEETHWVQGV